MKAGQKLTYKQTGLRRETSYKYYVQAYQLSGKKHKAVKTSLTVHSIAGNVSGKYANIKSVSIIDRSKKSVNKKGLHISVGKNQSFDIYPEHKLVANGKLGLEDGHCADFRYVKSNNNIKIVTPIPEMKGGTYHTATIYGKKKGTTKVYILASNGVRTSFTVTVR